MKTVLVVEDDGDIRQLIAMALEGSGFAAVCASDGEEALGAAHALDPPPSVVVLDWTMPGLSGDAFISAARACERLRSTPILVLSGIEERRVRAASQGYTKFLRKPFTPESLIAEVSALCCEDPA